jgi:hypothetical protein
MAGTIGSTGHINIGGTQAPEVDQTRGPGGPKGTQGPPTVGTEPPPVNQQPRGSGAPPLSPPKVDPNDADNHLRELMAKLQAGDGDMSVIMEQLERIQMEAGQQQEKTAVNEIKSNKKQIEINGKEQIAKLKESAEKLKADAGWDTAKKVFAVAGAILGILAAVGTVIATGGTGIAAALPIAVACFGALTTVLQVSGLQDKMFDALGMDQKARMWTQIAIAGVLLAGAISCIVVSAVGIGNAAAKVAETATKTGGLVVLNASSVAKETAAIGTSTAKALLLVVGRFAQAGMALTKIAEGGSAAVQTGLRYEVAVIEHDRKALARSNLQIQQQQDELMKKLKDLLKKMEDDVSATVQAMGSHHEVTSRIQTAI